MSAALETHPNTNLNESIEGSVHNTGILNLGKSGTGHLRQPVQDVISLYDAKNKPTSVDVQSFDDNVAQDLSIKPVHTKPSLTFHRQNESVLVNSNDNSKINVTGTDIKCDRKIVHTRKTEKEKDLQSVIDNLTAQLNAVASNSNVRKHKDVLENIGNAQSTEDVRGMKDESNQPVNLTHPDRNQEAELESKDDIQNLTRSDRNKKADLEPQDDVQNLTHPDKNKTADLEPKDDAQNLTHPDKNKTADLEPKDDIQNLTPQDGSKKADLESKDDVQNLTQNREQEGDCENNGDKKEIDSEKPVENNSAVSISTFSLAKEDYGTGNTFRCPECPWAFSSNSALRIHVTKNHKNKAAVAKAEVQQPANTRSKRSSVLYIRPKPFQCTKCYCSFYKRKELKEHSLSHSKQNHLKCHVCGLAFTKRRDLNEHIVSHDKKQQIAYCELCGKTFSQAGNLKIHLRIHTKEKPYTCEHCGKSYAQSGDLKTHIRVHTDERPYLCEFCGNLFHSLSHLGRHSKVHTKEKPYTCKVCGHSFAHAHHLKKHYRIHTKEKPYNCETCGKAFARSDYLKQHIRVHTKEKPYICKICGKGFSQGGSLRLHQRVHARQGILMDTNMSFCMSKTPFDSPV